MEPLTTTIAEEWEDFKELCVLENMDAKVTCLVKRAFYFGAQANLTLIAEAMGKFRDEIVEFTDQQHHYDKRRDADGYRD